MARLDAAIPTSPLVFADGNIRPEWRAFFNSLWLRTGGAIGQSNDGWQLPLAAETTARQQGDQQLGTALQQEVVARQTADFNETQARQTADATLVPKAQLCTLWAACDLSFLPPSDPGHGQPWLDGNHVAVGTLPGALVNIGLESATGDWSLEALTGQWQWG